MEPKKFKKNTKVKYGTLTSYRNYVVKTFHSNLKKLICCFEKLYK